jgi:16S rRNA processing protein RimM
VSANPVILGRIVGLFGVQGWVKVFSFTEPREAVLEHGQWLLGSEGDWESVRIAEGKRHGKGVIARLDGVDDRDVAAGLIGRDIGVPRDTLPEAAPGEYYWADLEGLRVCHKDGRELGAVGHLLETGANDVLVVRGDTERLIPFVMDRVILDVDLDRGVITVDWEWD